MFKSMTVESFIRFPNETFLSLSEYFFYTLMALFLNYFNDKKGKLESYKPGRKGREEQMPPVG